MDTENFKSLCTRLYRCENSNQLLHAAAYNLNFTLDLSESEANSYRELYLEMKKRLNATW